MENKIKWQTGNPIDPGMYIVTLLNGEIGVDEYRYMRFRSGEEGLFWVYYCRPDEKIIAWCKLSDIEPYNDNDNDNNNNISCEKFQDGDICVAKIKGLEKIDFIFIFNISERNEDVIRYYAMHTQYSLRLCKRILCKKKDLNKLRLATEEEKEKLFKEFHNRGYKWNKKTKTFKDMGCKL